MRQKTTINSKYSELSSFVNTIHEEFEKGGETIYKDRNVIKVFNVNGLLVNVKRFKVPHLLNRFAYAYVRKSKAERSYKYAAELQKRGINTPEPIANVLTYKEGILHYSYLITLQINDATPLYYLGESPLEEIKPFVEQFVRYTVSLHKVGVYHKDFSPGNILYRNNGKQTEFYLVDINRINFKLISIKEGCGNFARLWGKEELFRFIAAIYARERQGNTEQCTKWTLDARKRFWMQYKRRHPLPFCFE